LKKHNILVNNLINRITSLAVCFLVTTTAISSITASSFETKTVTKDSLSYTFTFAEPKFQKKTVGSSGYIDINLPGCMSMGREAGQPAMPVKFIKLLLPPKTTVKNVDVVGASFELDLENIDLKKSPIFPYQYPVPFGSEPEEFVVDNAFYSSEMVYPTKKSEDYSIGYSRGYAILDIALNPVQYIPNEGRIFLCPELTVKINLEESDYVNQFFRNNPEDEAWVNSLVSNPEITKRYTADIPIFDYQGGLCDPSDDFDYVIITTEDNGLDYWETTEETPYNWESLMNKHAEDDGFSCTVVTEQEIDACEDYKNDPPFDDIQAHIREFCKDAYQDWGTQYILIGGDGEWILPRQMSYEYEYNVEADIYWSNLDKNFNADEDDFWGEEDDLGFDLYTELFIGRLTCDEPKDVSNWMSKSFYYADSLEHIYLDNAAFYGGDTTWSCQGDDFIDYGAKKGTDNWLGPIPGDHGSYPKWLGFQFGFETWNENNPGGEYDLSVAWTAEPPNEGWQGGSKSVAIVGLKKAINEDRVTLISGIAHANSFKSLDVYSTDWESEYHNTKPFLIFDIGCHCGDFYPTDDGVLHSMLFHSDTELAFACIYHTSNGWGAEYDTNSSSALQMKLFWDYFFDMENNSKDFNNWRLGRAMAWSKDAMAPTINWTYIDAPGSWRCTIQACLLFGDPAQKVKPSNICPEKPQQPAGPKEGVTAVEYEFSATTIDPEGDSIYFMFDWDDGISSGWLGPYDSGQTGKASHIWNTEGYYNVTVKAKDEKGITSQLSIPLTIHILQAPRLKIRSVLGGLFKLNAIIKNTGSVDATNVTWKIKFSGSIFIGKETTGTIPKITAGREEAITSGFILGLGATVITVNAVIPEGSFTRSEGGIIYLFYIWLNPSGS